MPDARPARHRERPARARPVVTAALFALGTLAFAGVPASVCAQDGPGAAEGADVSVSGELQVLYSDDFERQTAELQYYVLDKQTGKHYRLKPKKGLGKALKHGDKVKVRGKQKGKEIQLETEDALQALDPDGGTSSATGTSYAPGAVVGEQRTIVLVTNLRDAPVSCSVQAVRDLMFTDAANRSVDDLYREVSRDQVAFTGATVGPFTIPYDSTGACDFMGWAQAADAAARAAGIEPSLYARKVYVMPDRNTCGWAGLASVGGASGVAWITRCGIPDVFAHELGHNLGMYHAATPTSEYGDGSDVMGFSGYGLRQVNAPHREQMGWYAPTRTQTVTADGVFDIAPLELADWQALAPQTLKVPNPATGEHLFLSYRRAIGFDAALPSTLVDRLSVHRYAPGQKTYQLAVLADGQSYTDAATGVTVIPVSHTADYMTVQVRFGQGGCTPAAPLASLAPASQSGAAGTTLAYTVSLTNRDSSACAASSFALARTLPAGWSGSLSAASLTLAPGATGQATLWVTSATSAAASSYAVQVQASDAATAVHAASVTGTYTVASSCSRLAPAVTLSPSSQSAAAGTPLSYSVSITNQDSAACAGSTFAVVSYLPAGWTGSVSPASLVLTPGTTGRATLSVTSPTSTGAGSYAVGVNLSDAATTSHAAAGRGTYGVTASSTASADTQAPTAPGSLKARVRTGSVELSWRAATDNVGVAGYRVLRNGAMVGQATGTTLVDTAVVKGQRYSYTVVAYDARGNLSPQSNAVTVTAK
jgi:hypothetical protein